MIKLYKLIFDNFDSALKLNIFFTRLRHHFEKCIGFDGVATTIDSFLRTCPSSPQWSKNELFK